MICEICGTSEDVRSMQTPRPAPAQMLISGTPSGAPNALCVGYALGVSGTFRLGGQTVFEISFAWGGGEGMQTYATRTTNNIGGVTAGLRGVF